MKKVMMLALSLGMFVVSCYAQDNVSEVTETTNTPDTTNTTTQQVDTESVKVDVVEVPMIGLIDLKNPMKNTRAGVAQTFDGYRYATAYTPIVVFNSEDGTEYVNISGGVLYETDIQRGYATALVGLRLDNLLYKAATSTEWMRKHITTATLPSLDFGPFVAYADSQWKVGINLAYNFK